MRIENIVFWVTGAAMLHTHVDKNVTAVFRKSTMCRMCEHLCRGLEVTPERYVNKLRRRAEPGAGTTAPRGRARRHGGQRRRGRRSDDQCWRAQWAGRGVRVCGHGGGRQPLARAAAALAQAAPPGRRTLAAWVRKGCSKPLDGANSSCTCLQARYAR